MNNYLNTSYIFPLEIGQIYSYQRHNILKEGIELHSGSKITITNLYTQNNGFKDERIVHFKIEYSGNIQETDLEETLFISFFSRYIIKKPNEISNIITKTNEDILDNL